MDRTEATGFGIATAGHLALLAALTLGFATAVKPPALNPPMEVAFVEDVAPVSAAPAPSEAPAAPKLAEVEGPVEEAPAPPVIEPAPQPKAVVAAPAPPPPPKPQPKQAEPKRPTPDLSERRRPEKPASAVPKQKAAAAAPAPKQSQAKPIANAGRAVTAKPSQNTGRLKGILSGISDNDSDSRSEAPRAQVASAAVRSSLAAEVLRQLKPHWKAPTGADVEQLRTELSITLAPNGSVTDIEILQTTGQTASNRPQVKLHQEQAVKAVRLAAPFRLPAEYYDAWKLLSPIRFDKRLSQ